MKPKFSRPTELALGSVLLLALTAPGWGKVRFDDPEDSPLFADSIQRAFAQFAVHDVVSLAARNRMHEESGGNGLSAGAVVVVEGTQWHRVTGAGQNGQPGTGAGGQPGPLSVTTDLTCGPTCAVSCFPTCSGGATCAGGQSCNGLTCIGPNCVVPTVAQPTCAGTVTCSPWLCPTYTPALCPATLFGVTIPQAGQIQISFNSSASLQYTLQYCTDLNSNEWLLATNAQGNGGLMTFSHTNNASISFYRLLITP